MMSELAVLCGQLTALYARDLRDPVRGLPFAERQLALRQELFRRSPRLANDLARSHFALCGLYLLRDPDRARHHLSEGRAVRELALQEGLPDDPQLAAQIREIESLFEEGIARATRRAEVARPVQPVATAAGADAESAARRNREYQAALADWKQLPWWKRAVTKPPKAPGNI
jgi:hypothetical protein